MRLSFILFLFVTANVLANTDVSAVMDSITLDDVTVVSDYRKFQAGAKIDRIGETQLEYLAEPTIDRVITRLSPVYVKGNAGGVSTIRFRGTSANHTSILLGGIDLNSLSLGHTNAASIPTYLFDGLSLQYGGASAINGSGSIGGTVYLEQQHSWARGVRARLSASAGSFGEQSYGSRIYISDGRWESVSRLYYFSKENDFGYNNPNHENYMTNPKPVRETQQGAALEYKGFLQELNRRFANGAQFTSTLWYSDSWQQTQPNMQSNRPDTPELHDKNFRSWLEYNRKSSTLNFKAGAGYVHDWELYGKKKDETIIIDRLIGEMSVSHKNQKGRELKTGALYKYIIPDVYSYPTGAVSYEQHLDLYLSYFIEPITNLKTTVNLRQMLATGFEAPFTPALMLEYKTISTERSLLNINAGISRSFRIPTLNDRYWGRRGNPDLRPEDGFNVEAGISYLYQGDEGHFKTRINVFYMDVDDWIQWIPGFVEGEIGSSPNEGSADQEWRKGSIQWTAQNVDRVISKGIELQTGAVLNFGHALAEAGLNYTWNPVINKNKDKPLIYAPEHMGNIFADIKLGGFSFGIDGSFTGQRYYNAVGHTLPSYCLTNLSTGYRLASGIHTYNLSAQVLNIFNTDYQNEAFFAMPGCSFRLTLTLDLFTN